MALAKIAAGSIIVHEAAIVTSQMTKSASAQLSKTYLNDVPFQLASHWFGSVPLEQRTVTHWHTVYHMTLEDASIAAKSLWQPSDPAVLECARQHGITPVVVRTVRHIINRYLHNCRGAYTAHYTGSGVFPVTSLLNHACEPNCMLVTPLSSLSSSKGASATTCDAVIIAGRDIAAGEELTLSYARNHALDAWPSVEIRAMCLTSLGGAKCGCMTCVTERKLAAPVKELKETEIKSAMSLDAQVRPVRVSESQTVDVSLTVRVLCRFRVFRVRSLRWPTRIRSSIRIRSSTSPSDQRTSRLPSSRCATRSFGNSF